MSSEPVLIDGAWRAAAAGGTFHAENPGAQAPLDEVYPLSTWDDCSAALDAATRAAETLRTLKAERRAVFLERYAARIEARRDEIVERAHLETALPIAPRLRDVELPRTTDQLRQAAAAAREGSWALPTIDTRLGIRSCYAALGPVVVLGPNNFPLAFGSVSGGDFAAAIAAGNPVIGKANTGHPGTTRLLAEEAHAALAEAQLPPATVQLLYRTAHSDGERLVADPRTGATGYTGSRAAGLALKAAADAAGKPIYLELSSVNPVVLLSGALGERSTAIAEELTGSCLLGSGQFCTNPGLLLLVAGPATESFLGDLARRFAEAPVGTLLSARVATALAEGIECVQAAGAELVVGGTPGGGRGYSFANTLLRASGSAMLERPARLQTECFGNSTLAVVADDVAQLLAVVEQLEGSLTGSIYSDTQGSDDEVYDRLAPRLRRRVGRLLNDRMPTGVAVSPAMNHGGPYPATGHPGFTAVGIPASLRRFAALECFDNVRGHRLPELLADRNPGGRAWRLLDGQWSRADVGG